MTGQEVGSLYKANFLSDVYRASYICCESIKPSILDKWNFICIEDLQGKGCWDLQQLEALKVQLSPSGSFVFFFFLYFIRNT